MPDSTLLTADRPATNQCPPWCRVPDQRHDLHLGEVHYVELSSHREPGELSFPALVAALYLQDGQLSVSLTGHTEVGDDKLTLDEAEQAMAMLAEIVAEGRRAQALAGSER